MSPFDKNTHTHTHTQIQNIIMGGIGVLFSETGSSAQCLSHRVGKCGFQKAFPTQETKANPRMTSFLGLQN
jgi:hypothetical protein